MLSLKTSVPLWPYLFLLLQGIHAHEGEHCDMCHYDGLDDQDCKDYGMLEDEFVGWNLASESCMAAFDIQISSPDPSLICGSASSFVNELRFGSSLNTAKLGLGVSEGGFFDESGALLEQITIGGQTIDCEASENDCYNALKTYFESDTNGKNEMLQVCDTLENAVVKDRQLAQSITRNRLCQESRDGTTIPDVCSPLWEQLEETMMLYNDTNCAGFAMGTQNQTVPGCEEGEDDHDHEKESASQSWHVNVPILSSSMAGAFLVVLWAI